MSETPQQPVAPLSIDTALRPVDELDPVQRPNLAGFLGMVRVLAALATVLFGGTLAMSLAIGDARIAGPLLVVVVVPALMTAFAHQGRRAADARAPFHGPLRRLLWLAAAPPIVALFVLVLFLFHVAVVAGSVDGDLMSASRTSAVMAHADLLQALVPAALLWGPAYPIVAIALLTQSGLRSWARAPLWIVTLLGWAWVVVADPLGVNGLVR